MEPSYDKLAEAAKTQFAKELRRKMVDNGINQVQVANLLGLSTTVISTALGDPAKKISEHLIRQVTRQIPGMEGSYFRFRKSVDFPFYPTTDTGELSTPDKLAKLEQINSEMGDLFREYLESVRELV